MSARAAGWTDPGGAPSVEPRPLEIYPLHRLLGLPQMSRLSAERLFEIRVIGSVFAVRANSYVVEELIDWSKVPDDPIFKLTFPSREMLRPDDFDRVADALRTQAPPAQLAAIVREIRGGMNPHPAGQMTLNRALIDGDPIEGLQHKYRETVLYFPSEGQTCHAYCTFCFRWPQFTGDKSLRMASTEDERLIDYLAAHREVTDVLITGGDPLIMKTARLSRLFEALRRPELDHVRTVRIGTKALSWWPYRLISDRDATELLRALARLNDSGKHVAIMAHINHPQELRTDAARQAIARLRGTGATIRSQSPLLAGINDDPAIWSAMWTQQVGLGIVPYYMFVVRDTGPRGCFDVPLARAFRIYAEAERSVSGLARTAKGPSMSTTAGKIEVLGVEELGGRKLFVLRMVQGRDPSWAYRPFFAEYDEEARWIDDLRPAFGERHFFFEDADGPARGPE
jgi:KamA family protein